MVMVVNEGLEMFLATSDSIGRLKRLKHLTHASQSLSPKMIII